MQDLNTKLYNIFKSRVEESPLGSVLEYAMFPAGKLFRPKLVLALAQDLDEVLEDHYLLSAAIEAHHAYSLVHDDLPCMDDDDIRRGRPSAHKRFGEWQALLGGDALINLSYQLLADLESPAAKNIISNFSKMMGAKGLILGQFMDLSHQKKSFEETLLMHELKTARLIQFSLQGSLLLCSRPKISQEEALEMGKIIGINFQLLDDLLELASETSFHEGEVNAFLNYDSSKVFQRLSEGNERIYQLTKEKKLRNLYAAYNSFAQKTFSKLAQDKGAALQKTGLKPQELEKLSLSRDPF